MVSIFSPLGKKLVSRKRGRWGIAPPIPAAVKLDDFDVDDLVLVGAGAAKALDGGGIKVTGPGSNVTCGLDSSTKYGSLDPTELGTVAFLADRVTDASMNSVQMALHRGATTATLTFTNEAAFLKGGRWIAASIDEFPTVKAAGVGAFRVRELMNMASPFSAQMRFDKLYYKAQGRPTVLLSFDDVYDTIKTVAYPALKARGFKGNVAVPTGFVGDAGKLTLADLQSLYADGWDMYCNSAEDTPFTAAADVPAALADISACRTYLQANGMPRASNMGCWPNGMFTQAHADAFAGAGFVFMRTGEPQSALTRFGVPPGIAMAFPSQGFTAAGFAAAYPGRLAEIKTRGTTQCFHFHADIAGAAVFTQFLDALKADYDANLTDVITWSEFWTRDGGASPP